MLNNVKKTKIFELLFARYLKMSYLCTANNKEKRQTNIENIINN